MQTEGLDALVLYTNLVRPSAVSYLTGFTPYWSDGVLLVAASGVPVFATALSKRVANWIRSVSPVGEIVNTPQPGAVLAQRIASSAITRIGVLELDLLPCGLYDEVSANARGREFVDATQIFAEVRRATDAAERHLVARADAIAVAALEQVDATARDAAGVVGAIERHARLNGAEEAYVAVAAAVGSDRRMVRATAGLTLQEAFAVRASIAYKGQWVRRTRTFAADASLRQPVRQAEQWLAGLTAKLEAGRALGRQITARLADLPDASLVGWMAESCIGSYPLQVIADAHSAIDHVPAAGEILVLSLALKLDGHPWLGAAPAIIGNP
jgi:Xaa-Pro aminopeptidase